MNQTEKTLLWASNIWIFADGLLGPLFAKYTETIGGGDIFEITYAWATYLAVSGVLVILLGKFSDISEKVQKRMLVFGYFLTSFFTFCYIFVDTTLGLFLVQIGLGIAVACINPTWYALYDKNSTKDKEGEIWAMSDGQSKVLTAFAVILGGFIVKEYSFTILFLLMSFFQFIAALYLLKIMKN